MACSCKHNQRSPDGLEKKPRTPCVFCAEKHLSTAYVLANEVGYEDLNRMYIIGELVLAQWHLKEHREVAMEIRKLRHFVQNRKEKDMD